MQVYGARTWGWRGNFGVHTWVAIKPANAAAYTVYEVIGWRLRWSDSVVAIHARAPDARWYGNEPELYADKRGEEAEKLIPRIDAAARSYPYANEYTAWPGPNSNTFVAWITRAVPELAVDLPPTAIGKDYLGGDILSVPRRAASGVQFSIAGLFALTASGVEGLEVNLLGPHLRHQPLRPGAQAAAAGAARAGAGFASRIGRLTSAAAAASAMSAYHIHR